MHDHRDWQTCVNPGARSACEDSASRRVFLCEAVLLLGSALAVPTAAPLPIGFVTARRARSGQAVYPLPIRDGVKIDTDHAVFLARYQGAVYAFVLWCPHQRTRLRWAEDAQRFQCPKHQSKYQPNGQFISGRATRGMDRYALRREGDTIVVDLDTVYEQDQDPAGWDAAVVRL